MRVLLLATIALWACDAPVPAHVPPLPASCEDGARNADETDVDCGGPDCSPCAADARCTTGEDCESRVCKDMLCQAPTCFDGVMNADEADVDCGGSECDRCSLPFRCRTDEDCMSRACRDTICQVPTGADGVLNGDETGVDCGGPECEACPT